MSYPKRFAGQALLSEAVLVIVIGLIFCVFFDYDYEHRRAAAERRSLRSLSTKTPSD